MRSASGVSVLVALALAIAPAASSAWTQRAPGMIAGFAVGTNVVVELVPHRTHRYGSFQVVRARSSQRGRGRVRLATVAAVAAMRAT